MNVKERLIQFIIRKGLSVAEFERICGVGNAYVSNIRVSVSRKALMKFLEHFPDLNGDWLLTGEGEMLKPQPSVTQIAGDNNSNVNINGTPNAFDALLKVVETYQEQINRLITIIEKKL